MPNLSQSAGSLSHIHRKFRALSRISSTYLLQSYQIAGKPLGREHDGKKIGDLPLTGLAAFDEKIEQSYVSCSIQAWLSKYRLATKRNKFPDTQTHMRQESKNQRPPQLRS